MPDSLHSADGHVFEPADLWQTRLPKEFRDRALRYEFFDEFTAMVDESGTSTVDSHRFRHADGTLADHAVEGRLRDLDADGIAAEVLYPNLGLNVHNTPDPALALAYGQVYNDYLAEAFVGNPRFVPIAAVPVVDIADAVGEVERVAKLGLRGILVPMLPPVPYFVESYDPLWAAAQANGLHVSFHIATGFQTDAEGKALPKQNPFASLQGTPAMKAGMRTLGSFELTAQAQRNIAGLVGSGVLERFPELHFTCVECNAHWLAGLMASMEKAWTLGIGQPTHYLAGKYDHSRPKDEQAAMINIFEDNSRWPYPLRPSEYVKRQLHVTFMDDPAALALREFTGVDALLWGADYPHPEGTWPRSAEALDQQFAGISDDDRAAITGGTLASLYDLAIV